MNLRNEIINCIEKGMDNDDIVVFLKRQGFNIEEIKQELIEEYDFESEVTTIGYDLIDNPMNKLRERIKWDNEIYGNINKHDIMRSKQYFQDENTKLSNELYRVKNLIKNRIFEYELLKKEIEEGESTKINTMAYHNIQYEICFMKILIDKANSK